MFYFLFNEVHIACLCPCIEVVDICSSQFIEYDFKINRNPIHQQCTKNLQGGIFFHHGVNGLIVTLKFASPFPNGLGLLLCLFHFIPKLQFVHQFFTLLDGDVCIRTGHI